ncbi:UDP-forming cellulose synthase catalytic subunit [Pseudomonas sp. sp1636]|uniref:UDP-forming cellulose synthase catalytic subunit n=1 Tax=Pseudomonas sp. sp1636 TaxID=3036707 RepID=UPI0025A5F63D|nr:UDP-forming cellulose synthase catalytic subunit [Pseudomonas sp. sp1636]MDM8349905.1 UDP-forming cellulose synthase catalytic subunit [Pseudomonas sp. sp1636]
MNQFTQPPAAQPLPSEAEQPPPPHPPGLLRRLAHALCWTLFTLESASWRWLLTHRDQLYPQAHWLRLRPADPLRVLLQSLWLLLIQPAAQRRQRFAGLAEAHRSALNRCRQVLEPLLQRALARRPGRSVSEQPAAQRPERPVNWWHMPLLLVGLPVLALCVTQPLELHQQALFASLLWLMALGVNRCSGRRATLILIVLSILASSRYFWWRYSSTLNWDDPLDLSCGLLLLAAESYSWLVLILGYLQSIWPLDRQPCPLPDDTASWPSVDIYIPTYNEDLSVVRPTVLAALGIDWPQSKLNIWLLDDGKRDEFRQFAAAAGVGYLTRTNNRHAKAGNLNAAMLKTSGEFIAIFDCDHIPTRSFLQMTMGWFLRSPRLGVMQTPHHFLSADPFERNLDNFRQTPNENTLFYGLTQNGNDLWDATFFCGSCAILRRAALDSIGGFAVETVTEDAHTSLRLHRHGWTSAYIRIPQAAGLATESLSAHIGQRIRWARGMVQIFRLDNPLCGQGLSLGQRLCYFNAMLHFLSGVPRLIYLTAPLAFLILHAYIIYAPALLILLFVVPHIVHSTMTNSRIQGRYRHSFWSEIYETVLSWYIARPTSVALFNPHKGTFNVTAKGGLIEDDLFDWKMAKPFLMLAALNGIGLLFGLYRLLWGASDERLTVLISLCWVLYNLIILGGALAVAAEVRQVRRSHRVELRLAAGIRLPSGHAYPCTLLNYSDGGVSIRLPQGLHLTLPEVATLSLQLRRGHEEFEFPARGRSISRGILGAELEPMDLRRHGRFVQCTFARADTWAHWHDGFNQDKPLSSLLEIARVGLSGYRQTLLYAPPCLQPLIDFGRGTGQWLASFVPVSPVFCTVQPGSRL